MCEWPQIYEERVQRARKPHRCCECGTQIQPGERYEAIHGLWDGQFSRFSTCLACSTIRHHIAQHVDTSEMPAFGELRAYLSYDLPATAGIIADMDKRRAALQHEKGKSDG